MTARRLPPSPAPLSIVILGLSITSSWGNGHATTYRALVRALERRGHRVTFLERNLSWYADNRDLPKPPYGETFLYRSLGELKRRFSERIRAADLVIVGSFVPEGIAVGVVDVCWQIDSTSSELARRTTDAPAACLAEIQSAGRGRRGRAWRMPLGGGVALSSLRRFDVGMAALSGLSLVAGLAAIRAIEDLGVDGVALKWPNDLVVDGRKLGGILVELGGDALGPCHAIVGIGLARADQHLPHDPAAYFRETFEDLPGFAGEPSRGCAFCVAAREVRGQAVLVDDARKEAWGGGIGGA